MLRETYSFYLFKNTLFFIVLSFLTLNIYANSTETFSKEATKDVVYTQKGDEKKWCPICGNDLKKHYKTSHTSKLQNASPRQYCSIRCLAKDEMEYGVDKNSIQALDVISEKFIDAKSAYYVLGSKIKGTMSQKSKLAFLNKDEAIDFIKKYGGNLKTFEESFLEAKNSLKKDDLYFKKRKVKKTYLKGKRVFEKLCKTKNEEIDLSIYLEINELKADIKNNNLCKKLDESMLHAVSLYLWEVKRFGTLDSIEEKVHVNENEKCPVCGMFVAKYPRWAAKIFYKQDDKSQDFSFDGVKDLMKFYFNPLKWGDYNFSKDMKIGIQVTDYYSQKAIDGRNAYYVIGSDIYGPMGNELIPFENFEDAKVFKDDHLGRKILRFDEIKEKEVYKLDEI